MRAKRSLPVGARWLAPWARIEVGLGQCAAPGTARGADGWLSRPHGDSGHRGQAGGECATGCQPRVSRAPVDGSVVCPAGRLDKGAQANNLLVPAQVIAAGGCAAWPAYLRVKPAASIRPAKRASGRTGPGSDSGGSESMQVVKATS